jgi:hypothetical protein
MLVAAVTTVASVVTPAVVATALMLQKAAIATAAIALANLGDKRRFIISVTIQFSSETSWCALNLESDERFLLTVNKKPR